MKTKIIFILYLLNFYILLNSENISNGPVNLMIESDTKSDIYNGFRTMSEVIHLIETKAIRRVDFKKFIEEGLKSSVSTCDGHSGFFNKKAYKETLDSTSGKFSGIGVSILGKSTDEDSLGIVDVIEDGPAYKAGCRAGDEIIEVNGEKLRGLTSDEIVSKLKGPSGTKVKTKIIRNKKILEFTITRDIVKNEPVISYYFPKQNIFYMSLRMFSEIASKSISSLLIKASKNKCKGIIIDLRRNPGGILEVAVDIAGLFLDKGSPVVYTKNRDGKIVSTYKTSANPIYDSSTPIFFLIDNFTASASEILAGSLRVYSENASTSESLNKLMVFIVGTQSFGKGSVQEVLPISNGCALKLTTMLYYLPNNESIQAEGIKPDFLVKYKIFPDEDAKIMKEFCGTEKATRLYITREEVDKIDGKKTIKKEEPKPNPCSDENNQDKQSWDEKHRKALAEDQVVQAAINLINLFNVAKKCSPETVSTRQKALNFLKNNFIGDEGFDMEKIKS